MEVGAERALDLLRLAESKQAVVHEDAHQLIADRVVDDGGGHRAVDPAGETADHGVVADPLPDVGNRLLDDPDVGPRGPGTAHVVEEPLHHVLSERRVGDLGVELHPVDAPGGVFHRRHRRVGRRRRHPKARWRRDHGVAVAHPHRLVGRLVGEQHSSDRRELGLAVFGDIVAGNAALETVGDELMPVANAEHRDPQLEDARIDLVRIIGIDGRRPT